MANLFGAVMLFGIFSLLSASLYVVLDAVDVALTEAAVGAGISTILLLSALSLTGSRIEIIRNRRSAAAAVTAAAAGIGLLWGLSDLPQFGDPAAPANLHVAPFYLNESSNLTGIPNVVTSILASFRGYDTLGEVVVIFTAGVGVIALLSGQRRTQEDERS